MIRDRIRRAWHRSRHSHRLAVTVFVAGGVALAGAMPGASLDSVNPDADKQPEAETMPGASLDSVNPDADKQPAAQLAQPHVLAEGVSLHVVPDQLLVRFEPGTPQATINGVLSRARARPEDVVDEIGVRVIDVDPTKREQVLAALKASPAVEYAERDVAMIALEKIPNDPHWSAQWGPRKVSANAAWDTTTGSRKVVVAVLDTGVDLRHPDLAGALVPGYDLVNDDADPRDDQGHGTAVAGIIAARTNNSAGQAGVCWGCSIMPLKVLDSSGSGSTSTIAKGIVWAVDNGARIINLSLGGPGTSQALTDAVAYAASKGVPMFAAAGNNGSETMFYPAAYAQVLAVAGTDPSDRLYSWSNRGAWVQVAAPGCNVATARGGGYENFCGTSSATPVVSGLAGLALSAPGSPAAADLYPAVKSSAQGIGSGVQFGRVSAAGTLFALGAVQPSSTTTYRGSLGPQHPSRTYRRSVGAGPATIVLTFKGVRKLSLRLVNSRGKTVAYQSGTSPLRIKKSLKAAAYRFRISGAKKRAPFTLRVTAVRR
jgi:subtilisin family serine protease